MNNFHSETHQNVLHLLKGAVKSFKVGFEKNEPHKIEMQISQMLSYLRSFGEGFINPSEFKEEIEQVKETEHDSGNADMFWTSLNKSLERIQSPQTLYKGLNPIQARSVRIKLLSSAISDLTGAYTILKKWNEEQEKKAE